MSKNRWDTVSKEVLDEALQIVSDMMKHKELTNLQYENKNLKHEVEFLRNHITELVKRDKEKE